MKFIKKKLLFSLFCCLAFFLSTVKASSNNAFVHLFEWKWKDVARECEEYLALNGYSAVQVSPPQEHVLLNSSPWYERYQPVSYKIEGMLGNKVEFSNMVKRCNRVGIKVYVDAVINHMSGVLPIGVERRGSANSTYMRYSYENLYSYDDFHHCKSSSDSSISDWSNRFEIQNCELLNLGDLNTSKLSVQLKIANYLNELINIGVAGFRVDAAKHISSNDIYSIKKMLSRDVFIFQEVIDHGNSVISSREYLKNGSVTEFKFSSDVGRIFKFGDIKWFNSSNQLGENWSYIESSKSIVFIDNHDLQRAYENNILTHRDGSSYILANIFMLAWPYGYPKIMSSYKFTNKNSGSPKTSPFDPQNELWLKEHRHYQITKMVKFRKFVNKTDVVNWWGDNNVIAFGRGSRGFVIINNSKQVIKRWFKSSIVQGNYQNVLSKNGKRSVVTINNFGWFYAEISPKSAFVIQSNEPFFD